MSVCLHVCMCICIASLVHIEKEKESLKTKKKLLYSNFFTSLLVCLFLFCFFVFARINI